MFRSPLGYCTALHGSAVGILAHTEWLPVARNSGERERYVPSLKTNALHRLPSVGVSVLSAAVRGALPGSSEDPPAAAAAAAAGGGEEGGSGLCRVELG